MTYDVLYRLDEAMSDGELLEVYLEADKENTESLTVDQLAKFYSGRGVSAKFLMVRSIVCRNFIR